MRYVPIQEGFWWKVKIGDGNQKIGKCFSETEAQRLAAALETAFEDGKYVGAASRDAEIARLKTVPMKYRRMAFNAQLQDEVAKLENERDQLRERVALLRDALKEAVEDYSDRFDMSSPSTNPGIKWIVKQGKEALTATEPKP